MYFQLLIIKLVKYTTLENVYFLSMFSESVNFDSYYFFLIFQKMGYLLPHLRFNISKPHVREEELNSHETVLCDQSVVDTKLSHISLVGLDNARG